MSALWVLYVISCSGPGPTGKCPEKREATYHTRWDCRLESIRREMADDRVRAYCKLEGT